MSDSPQDVLRRVFIEVLEKVAFMFAEAIDERERAPEAPSDCMLANMTFSGSMAGRLDLVVPIEMCAELPANMLGMDPEDESFQRRGEDALKELLNITCGNFLTAFAGEEATFNMGTPSTSWLNADGWQSFISGPGCVLLKVDYSYIVLRLSLV